MARKSYSAGEATVDIAPDFSNFVKKLRAELNRVNAGLEIDVTADTKKFRAAVKEAKDEAKKRVQVSVDADTGEADAKNEALRKRVSRPIKTKVEVDTSQLKKALGELPKAGLLNLGALGVGNLPAAATALASVATSVQQVSQAGLLLPGIFAGAGAGISTMVVGLQGMKDALGDSPEKAAAAYEKMGANAREVVDTVKSYDDQLSGVRSSVQEILLSGVGGALKGAIDNDLGVVKTGMEGVAGQLSTGIKTTLDELGNEQSQNAISTIFANTATAAGNANGAITPLIDTVRRLATTGSKFLPEMGQGLTNIATKFDAFITRADESGDLWRWMREGIDGVKTLGSVVGNLGSSLASVLRGAKGDGEGFLVTVDHLTERMANWLKSDEGQDKLKAFFREGREQLDGWKPILESIPGLLKQAYDASQTWSGIVMPFLRAAAGLLREHGDLVKTAVVAYLAFKTVSPAIDGVRGALTAANGALGTFKRGAREASDNGAGRLKSAMGGVSTLIGSAMGGPWGLAIGAATVGLGYLATKHQEAAEKAEAQKRALEQLQTTLDKQSGLATKATEEEASKMLEKSGALERAQTLGINSQDLVRASVGLDANAKDDINQKLTGIVMEQARPNSGIWSLAREQSGLDQQTIAEAVAGMPNALEQYRKARENNKDVPGLDELKNDLNDIGESAATLAGEMNNADSEVAKFGESNRRIAAAQGQTNALTKQGADEFRAMGIAIENVTAEDGKTVLIKTPTDEQKTKLGELGQIVETLPDGSVRIVLDDAKARQDITEITKPETKNVTVSVTNPALAFNILNQAGIGPDAKARPGLALGGAISGGIAGKDSVPLLGMPGEHMLTTSDVDKLGGQGAVYRFRAALQAGLVKGFASGGAVGWTNEDEQSLQKAIQAQQKAEADQGRDLQFKKDITDEDKRDLQQRVNDARQKVAELQQKKNSGGVTPTTTLPQADQPGYKSESQINIENAQMSVDEANTKRNQVYSNPNSTPNDKQRADNDYLTSQRQLRSAQKAKDKSSEDENALPDEYSVPGIFASLGGLLGAGLLSAFGLENSALAGNNPYNRAFNQITKFYGDKDKEAAESGDENDDTNTGYTPKNLPVEDQAASQGGLYTGQSGYDAYASGNGDYSGGGGSGVEQWRNTFAGVLSALGMPASWVSLGLAQMQTESGGDPKAINNYDSNAAAGTPSKGLMQVIDPTFAAYRSQLYANDIWNPSANIAAALQYTVARYGGPEGVWGQGHGYADGGWITGVGGPRSDSNRIRASVGEFMVNASAAAANGPLLEAINAGIIPAPAALPVGMTPVGGDSGRTVKRDHSVNFNGDVHLMDVDHLMREQDRYQSIQAQGNLVTYG